MKLPRALSFVLLTGCGGVALSDGGSPDASLDAGPDEDAGSGGACVLNKSCDAGAGQPAGYCVLLTEPDGGRYEACQVFG